MKNLAFKAVAYSFVFLFSVTCSAQSRVVRLNGGLQAEVLTLGRNVNHTQVTLSVRILNQSRGTAYLALIGNPTVTDNEGGSLLAVLKCGGLVQCPWGLACFGSPRIVEGQTLPIQGFTQIDPGVDITATMVMFNGKVDGPLLTFSGEVAYRIVLDTGRDATLPDSEKYKQFRVMGLTFPSMSVTEAK